jgi:succinoglycan biosynthesis transport protein ExoP
MGPARGSVVARPDHQSKSWLEPPADQQGLQRYVETIRERIWVVIAAVVVTTGVAVVYVATAETVYEAEADVLVAPIADETTTPNALGLISESTDPLRPVETAATLIHSDAAASLTAEELGLDVGPESILEDVSAEPVAESDVVTVTARASSAEAAAELANAFVRSAIRNRTEVLYQRIDEQLPRLEARLEELPPGLARDSLTGQIAELETLRAGSDPTLQIAEPATEPNSPVSPRPLASFAAAIVAGLVLGIGGAFALQVFDPRLRREEQLRQRYRLPVLARIPREPRYTAEPLTRELLSAGPSEAFRSLRAMLPTLAQIPRERPHRAEPLTWERLSPGPIEAYRTLRAILARPHARSRSAGSILVTSPGPAEGNTTTALNLAWALAQAGKRVILIEADLRRPSIARALGVRADHGMISVLTEEAKLEECLIAPDPATDNFQVLVAERAGIVGGELLALPAAQRLAKQAKLLADYVVVDSPPLATVVDALPLAGAVDDLLLVVRLGVSRISRLEQLAELLADTGIKPTGFVLVGAPPSRDAYYGDRGLQPGAERPERPLSARSG